MSQVDPWSQLAAVAPTGAPRHLAYVDGEAAGYDVRMALPSLCLTCGTSDGITTATCKVRAQANLEMRIAAHLRGERLEGVVRVGDSIALALPTCGRCAQLRRRAGHLTLAVRLVPFWGFALAVVALIVHPALLLLVIAAIAAVVVQRMRVQRYVVVVESIDGDGIVRISPVHPDASMAILVAAGMQPA
jgi:hypothetical protein